MRGQSAEIRFVTPGAPEDGGKTSDTQPTVNWSGPSISLLEIDTTWMPFRGGIQAQDDRGRPEPIKQCCLTQGVVVDTYLLLGCRDFYAI